MTSKTRSDESPRRDSAAQFARFALAGSLVPPLIGIYALAVTNSHYWSYSSALTWYGLLSCGLLELALRRGWRLAGPICLMLASLHLVVLTPEVYLRLAGFQYESGVRFGYPRPHQFLRFRADENLFWTLRPDSPGVNPQGFRARPLPRPAEPDLARAVVLGDSVAFQGYPEIVETLLNARQNGTGRWEVLNMSIAGYSSYQGRRLVERYGDAMAADVAVIGYVWNDHWLAWGTGDGDKAMPVERSAARRQAADLVRRSRVVQAARRLLKLGEPGPSDERRVPLAQYRENLEFLGAFWDARGAQSLFVTLPTSHHRLGVPEFLVGKAFARDQQSVLDLHRAYNQVVREVAGAGGWPVLDLEAELGSLGAEDLRQIFLADGIHLTPAGLALFAQRVAAAIAELTVQVFSLPEIGEGGSPEHPFDRRWPSREEGGRRFSPGHGSGPQITS